MAQVEIPPFKMSRRRTRTYDQTNDPADLLQALTDLICPAGGIIPTLSAVEPDRGWKLCNGQSLSKADFPRLYAVIGDAFGATETTFALPDLRGRMPLGANGSFPLLTAGGAASVTLTTAQLPAHSHNVTDPGHSHTFTGASHSHTVTDPGHSHGVTDPGHTHGAVALDVDAAEADAGSPVDGAAAGSTGSASTGISVNSAGTGLSVDAATAGGSIGSASTGISIANTGDGEAIPTLPPYIALNWLVRT